jgi:exopolyphosphatase/guanosine-5'-triphosphate,3'-diphosphate pyrophosphatase
MSRIASLDVGSNTVRLLIAESASATKFRSLRVERIITRLGGGFSPARGLDEAAMERTLAALRSFADLVKREKAERVFAVGTGVLREAGNGRAFMEAAERETGLSIRLLTGEEEARLMLRGVMGVLRDREAPRLVTDVGGWSTEVLWVEGGKPLHTASLALGAVALTENFLTGDPPSHSGLQRLSARIRSEFFGLRGEWERKGKRGRGLHPHLVGTAGTATTLAAMDLALPIYDPRKIDGHLISLPGLRQIYHRLQSLQVEERRKIAGLEKGREDLIVAGSAVLLTLMEIFDRTALEVVDSGLLEGVLLEGIERLRIGDCGLRIAKKGNGNI